MPKENSKTILKHAAAVGIVIAVTVAAFWPVLHNGFLNYDDAVYFLGNPSYRGLGWANLTWMWTTRCYGAYQPLSWMTLGLDYLIWGMNPFGYHLANLIFHALNAALFYVLTLRLLKAARPEARGSETLLAAACAFAALIFSVHPLRVESVAWASERRDVLSGTFYLAALLSYLEAARPRASRVRWLGAALACFFLSLSAKGVVVTLPLALLLLDVYPLKRLPGEPAKWAAPEFRPVWLEKIPFFILAAIFGAVGLAGLRQAGAMNSWARQGLAERLAQSAYGLVFYLGKTIFPAHLLPLYPIPIRFNPLGAAYLLSAAVVLIISGVLFKARRRRPELLAAWVYYAITLFPMLGLVVSFRTYFTADRYSYLSCMGWAVLAGAGALFLLKRLDGWARRMTAAALGALVAALACLTWGQAKVWRSPQSLWSYAVAQDPDNVLALSNLGAILEQKGKFAQAVALYRQALALNPGIADIYANLGVAYQNEGDLPQAVSAYRQAIALGDKSPVIRANLALALSREKR